MSAVSGTPFAEKAGGRVIADLPPLDFHNSALLSGNELTLVLVGRSRVILVYSWGWPRVDLPSDLGLVRPNFQPG
jgi:hypothetical protein